MAPTDRPPLPSSAEPQAAHDSDRRSRLPASAQPMSQEAQLENKGAQPVQAAAHAAPASPGRAVSLLNPSKRPRLSAACAPSMCAACLHGFLTYASAGIRHVLQSFMLCLHASRPCAEAQGAPCIPIRRMPTWRFMCGMPSAFSACRALHNRQVHATGQSMNLPSRIASVGHALQTRELT